MAKHSADQEFEFVLNWFGIPLAYLIILIICTGIGESIASLTF